MVVRYTAPKGKKTTKPADWRRLVHIFFGSSFVLFAVPSMQSLKKESSGSCEGNDMLG